MPTVNGINASTVVIRLPHIGAWHADVKLASETVLTGAVTVDIDGEQFVGTVLRSGANGGHTTASIVGGNAGLSKALPSKAYSNGPNYRRIVEDILRETGETVSSTADTAALGGFTAKWDRSEGPASRALTEVLDTLGLSWRVLRDGSIWVGTHTYPEVTPTHRVLDENWPEGTFLIAPDRAELEPGVTFLGQQIQYVVHEVSGSSLRTQAYLESPGGLFNRMLAGVRRGTVMSRLYGARVAKQNADGTLQLVPDDPMIKGLGLDNVQIRHGLPGWSAKVPSGARVQVGFENGNPARPFAALWNTGSVTELVFDGGSKSVARVDDGVTIGTLAFTPGSGGASLTWNGTTVPPTGVEVTGRVTEGNEKLKA